jgi:hypothetical protein
LASIAPWFEPDATRPSETARTSCKVSTLVNLSQRQAVVCEPQKNISLKYLQYSHEFFSTDFAGILVAQFHANT